MGESDHNTGEPPDTVLSESLRITPTVTRENDQHVVADALRESADSVDDFCTPDWCRLVIRSLTAPIINVTSPKTQDAFGSKNFNRSVPVSPTSSKWKAKRLKDSKGRECWEL